MSLTMSLLSTIYAAQLVGLCFEEHEFANKIGRSSDGEMPSRSFDFDAAKASLNGS